MISVIWKVGNTMGLVLEEQARMTTRQGVVPQSLTSLVEDVVRAEGWNMRPWDGKDSGWVATRKEN